MMTKFPKIDLDAFSKEELQGAVWYLADMLAAGDQEQTKGVIHQAKAGYEQGLAIGKRIMTKRNGR